MTKKEDISSGGILFTKKVIELFFAMTSCHFGYRNLCDIKQCVVVMN